MKKIVIIFAAFAVFSCGTKPVATKERPIYEILTQQSDGGANIQFYEVLTEQKEIVMLQSDENLKKKIGPADITSSNFIILNMGEKPTGGHFITVEKVEELQDKIVVTVKENGPDSGTMATQVISYPYTIVKINSKKPIEIK